MMRTGSALIGFLFLINPELITVDLLPDFVGFLLIARGLRRLSYLEERMMLARRYAFVLALSSVIKLLSSIIAVPTNIESTRLTISFCFLIVNLWLELLLVDNTMKGLQYLAVRNNGDLVLKNYELVKGFLTAFFIVKEAAHFLPQGIAAVFPHIDADPDLVDHYQTMISSFQTSRSILFVVGSLCLILFGIYTARILKAYRDRCRSDLIFCESLKQKYREKISENDNALTVIGIKKAFLLFFLASVFLFDIYFDGINILPNPFFSFFVWLGFGALRPFVPLSRWHRPIAFSSFLFSLMTECYRIVFWFTSDAFSDTFPVSVWAKILFISSRIFDILLLVLLLNAVSKAAARYTEYSFRRVRIGLIIAFSLVILEGYFAYLFLSEPIFITVAVWGFFAAGLYYFKKSLDEIRAEIEYKLM